jgi:hypothetical protein
VRESVVASVEVNHFRGLARPDGGAEDIDREMKLDETRKLATTRGSRQSRTQPHPLQRGAIGQHLITGEALEGSGGGAVGSVNETSILLSPTAIVLIPEILSLGP